MMAAKTRDLFIFKDFSELTKQFPEIALAARHQDSSKKHSISSYRSGKLYKRLTNRLG
jgi:hypothetical protein